MYTCSRTHANTNTHTHTHTYTHTHTHTHTTHTHTHTHTTHTHTHTHHSHTHTTHTTHTHTDTTHTQPDPNTDLDKLQPNKPRFGDTAKQLGFQVPKLLLYKLTCDFWPRAAKRSDERREKDATPSTLRDVVTGSAPQGDSTPGTPNTPPTEDRSVTR